MQTFFYYSTLGTLFFCTLVIPRCGIVPGIFYTWVFFSILTLIVMGIEHLRKKGK